MLSVLFLVVTGTSHTFFKKMSAKYSCLNTNSLLVIRSSEKKTSWYSRKNMASLPITQINLQIIFLKKTSLLHMQ